MFITGTCDNGGNAFHRAFVFRTGRVHWNSSRKFLTRFMPWMMNSANGCVGKQPQQDRIFRDLEHNLISSAKEPGKRTAVRRNDEAELMKKAVLDKILRDSSGI